MFDDDIINTTEVPNTKYRILEIDLSDERNFEEIPLDRVYNEFSAINVPNTFDIYFNDKANDKIPILTNQLITIDNFKIERLWITNTASSGTAYIWLASKEE